MKHLPRLHAIGPGLVMAATGLGAGDLIAASVAGARYGTALLWAVIIGALLKFALNEGLARWQLASGMSLIEGWARHLPRLVNLYFGVYLCLWSFVVAAALMAACGLAAYALFPVFSVTQWGIAHALATAVLVLTGRYLLIEKLMKLLIVFMFAVILICALRLPQDWPLLIGHLLQPRVPAGSLAMVLGVIGGVGGSVTLMSYGYWMREKGWTSARQLADSRLDLAVAYTLTGVFGIAIMLVSAGAQPEAVSGSKMALAVAERLETVLGPTGKWLFLTCFWGAVFSSMVGVWHGVPYLFSDFVHHWRRPGNAVKDITRTASYRGFLVFLTLPPMLLLAIGKPVWLVIAYAVTGAFFMPLLALLLLYMNNQRKWLGNYTNGWPANLALASAVVLFGYLLADKLVTSFGS